MVYCFYYQHLSKMSLILLILNIFGCRNSVMNRMSSQNSVIFLTVPLPFSYRSTISSGPFQHSRFTERSGTTWSSLSPRQSATLRTMRASTPGTLRCQSSSFTYSVSSSLVTALCLCACRLSGCVVNA